MEFIQDSEDFKPNDCWRGVNIIKLGGGCTTLYPPVKHSTSHTVTVELPVSPDSVPKPYRKHTDETWTKHHVHLPFSQKSLIQLEENTVRKRWEVIQEALLRPITNSKQLEEVICSYNNKKWKFPALHYLFRTELDQLETDIFFKQLLPKIINLALRLPNVLQCGIPLLKAHSNHSITLSQLQIASLLANAFLCTYPRRNSNQPESQYANFPCINFSRLFQAQSSCVSEKLKCLINYFVRVTTKDPTGLVTYSRRYLPHSQLPHWGDSRRKLPDLFISSEGMIENQRGLLQVDFANKFVGGGVLGYGGVQEEIRFVICPELIVAQLFTECLNSTEALIVSGVERYNDYEGYSRSFTWTGNYKDRTPSDIYGRKLCTVLAIDAVNVARNPKAQYSLRSIERELNKAYVGFSWGQEDPSRRGNTVATGNWGCGAFKGDVQLKALLQIMAAGEASASIAYFTFGNAELTNGIYDMYTLLKQYRVDVGRLFTLLASYESHVRDGSHESITLYEFLYNTVVLNNSKQDGSPGKSSDKSPGKQGDSDVKTKRNTSPDLSENSIRPGNSKTTWRNSLGFNTKSSSSFYSSGTSSFSNRNSITKSTTHSQNGSHRSCDVIDSNDTIDDMLQKIEASEAALLRKKSSIKNINCQSNISELEKVYAGNSKEVSLRNSSHREVSSRVNRIDVFNENLSEPNKLREVTANNSSCSKTTPSSSQNSSTYFTNERCRQDQAFSNINRNESKSNTISASKCQVVTNGNVSIDSVKNNQDFVIQIEEDDETSVDRCVSPDVINSSVAETPVKNTQDLFSEDEEMQVDSESRYVKTVENSSNDKIVKNTQDMFSEDEDSVSEPSRKSDSKNNNVNNESKLTQANKRNSCDTSLNKSTNKTNTSVNDTSGIGESEEIKLFKRIQRNSWADLERSRKDMKCDELEKEIQIMDTSDDLSNNGPGPNDSPKIRKTDKNNAARSKNRKITDYFSKEIRK